MILDLLSASALSPVMLAYALGKDAGRGKPRHPVMLALLVCDLAVRVVLFALRVSP